MLIHYRFLFDTGPFTSDLVRNRC